MKRVVQKPVKNKSNTLQKSLGLAFAGMLLFNIANAQQDFVVSFNSSELNDDVNHFEHYVKPELKDTYEALSEAVSFSSVAYNLHKEIADYDIKTHFVYDNSEKAIYDVSFKRKNSKAHVVYNNEGNVIKSTAVYKNIVLPFTLRVQIMQDNPMFEIISNKVKVTYNNFLGISISYKVVISKGKQRKTLRFDENYDAI